MTRSRRAAWVVLPALVLSATVLVAAGTGLQAEQTDQPEASASQPASIQRHWLTFEPVPDLGVYALGPEIKWTVSAPRRGHGCFIDLDTGKLSDGPDAEQVKQPAPGHEVADLKKWAAQEGVDLLADGGMLCGLELVLIPANKRSWNDGPPSTLVSLLKQAEAATPALLRPAKELPMTLLFRTREGAMGVLQVVGLVEHKLDVPGLKVRYKLLQRIGS